MSTFSEDTLIKTLFDLRLSVIDADRVVRWVEVPAAARSWLAVTRRNLLTYDRWYHLGKQRTINISTKITTSCLV